MDLQQVAPGLWRWALTHPEWEPPEQEDSPADWPAEVGCVAYETPSTLVLIDPLVVDGDHAALDEHAAAKERVAILVTVKWHERSRAELTRRYDASTTVPEGVEAFEIPGAGETIFWIPEHGALVPGDRILGDRPPGLRMCPESCATSAATRRRTCVQGCSRCSTCPWRWCSSRTASPCCATVTPHSSALS